MSGPLLDAGHQLALRERPKGPPKMLQKWRDLTFLHFPVQPEVVQRTLPAGLEVDTFDGQAWIGLVPFWMTDIRFRSIPRIPGHHTFPETNVRTYVHRNGEKPGVWFYTLEAQNRAAVAVARATFNLPYRFARLNVDRSEDRIRYLHRRGEVRHDIQVQVCEQCPTSEPGSFQFWLVERYLLYASKFGQLYSGQVYHTPYEVRQIELLNCKQNLIESVGFEATDWKHLCFSPGVDVEVFGIQKLS